MDAYPHSTAPIQELVELTSRLVSLTIGLTEEVRRMHADLYRQNQPCFPPLPSYYHPIWNISIDELELATRTHNALVNDAFREIRTIGDLMDHSKAELLRTPNFGSKGLRDVEETLWGQFGLKLKDR